MNLLQQISLCLSLTMAVYLFWPSITWVWSKRPALRWPWPTNNAVPAVGPVTGAQALAAVDVIERYRADSAADPSFAAVKASVKTLAEQMA